MKLFDLRKETVKYLIDVAMEYNNRMIYMDFTDIFRNIILEDMCIEMTKVPQSIIYAIEDEGTMLLNIYREIYDDNKNSKNATAIVMDHLRAYVTNSKPSEKPIQELCSNIFNCIITVIMEFIQYNLMLIRNDIFCVFTKDDIEYCIDMVESRKMCAREKGLTKFTPLYGLISKFSVIISTYPLNIVKSMHEISLSLMASLDKDTDPEILEFIIFNRNKIDSYLKSILEDSSLEK